MSPPNKSRSALAVAAHPDDIEFMMAGTLLLLKEAGYEIHYLNISSGNCGSLKEDARTTRRIRAAEARAAAKILGARFHSSFADDLEIHYDLNLLRRLAGIVRQVNPAIILTHSPEDYMEDHMNTCRLAVTAAFSRGMPNFKCAPSRAPVKNDVTVYHAMPYGLRDPLGRRIVPGFFVNTARVQEAKRHALAAHRSQQAWLDASQRVNSYLGAMEAMSIDVGRMSGRFKYAEGWRRHSHLGFCAPAADPLRDALGRNVLPNLRYAARLRAGEI